MSAMLSIRRLTIDDLSWAMRLKTLAGWNQIEADWRRAIALEPTGCFAGEWNGAPVATLTTCVFGPVAWIAMVLVDPEHRGRGIATSLMRHALEYLAGRGIASIRLDATSLGRPVYERLGFRVDRELIRYRGTPNGGELNSRPPKCEVRRIEPDDWESLAALDSAATGTQRTRFLHALGDDGGGWTARDDDGTIRGFALTRAGSGGVQLGPVIATTDAAGSELFRAAIIDLGGVSIVVDVGMDHILANQICRQIGLTVERKFLRMTRGPSINEASCAVWASSGPEKG